MKKEEGSTYLYSRARKNAAKNELGSGKRKKREKECSLQISAGGKEEEKKPISLNYVFRAGKEDTKMESAS